MEVEVGELAEEENIILRSVAVVYKLNPLYVLHELDPLCSLSAASIRKLYKLHLVLEMSSTVTLCRLWGCEILAYIQDA